MSGALFMHAEGSKAQILYYTNVGTSFLDEINHKTIKTLFNIRFEMVVYKKLSSHINIVRGDGPPRLYPILRYIKGSLLIIM